MGLVPPSTLWRCTKAVYGLKESPKMWEVHKDQTPPDVVCYGEQDGAVPRSYDDLKGKKVATFIVYVDDLLAVGHKTVLEGFFKHLQSVWEIATPEYLTGEPEDVESIRFFGMEIEKDVKNNNWIVHQQLYVMDTLNKFVPVLS
eukprot:3101562-Amphidinium_carterae.1